MEIASTDPNIIAIANSNSPDSLIRGLFGRWNIENPFDVYEIIPTRMEYRQFTYTWYIVQIVPQKYDESIQISELVFYEIVTTCFGL